MKLEHWNEGVLAWYAAAKRAEIRSECASYGRFARFCVAS